MWQHLVRIFQDPSGGSVGRDCGAESSKGPTAGVAGVLRGAEGQLAGRLCPDTGAEDRAGIYPGLAECSPRMRWEEAEQQWGGEIVARGPCLVQKPVCRSPRGDAAERVGYRLQGSRRGSQAGHTVHNGLHSAGPERGHHGMWGTRVRAWEPRRGEDPRGRARHPEQPGEAGVGRGAECPDGSQVGRPPKEEGDGTS